MVTTKKPEVAKFVRYETFTWPDGMQERDKIYKYKGKLWSSEDVLFSGTGAASKALAVKSAESMKKAGYTAVAVLEPRGRGYLVLHRKSK